MWISRSVGSVIFVVALLVVAMSLVSLFFLADDVFEAIESLPDDASIALQPRIELLERLRSKAIDPLLRDRTHLDEPRVAQHAEVLRDLGLPEAELRDDLPHCAGLSTKQLDDLKAVRFRQGAQRGLHGSYIPLQAYACQGISLRHDDEPEHSLIFHPDRAVDHRAQVQSKGAARHRSSHLEPELSDLAGRDQGHRRRGDAVIPEPVRRHPEPVRRLVVAVQPEVRLPPPDPAVPRLRARVRDRKSTRLNSSHS